MRTDYDTSQLWLAEEKDSHRSEIMDDSIIKEISENGEVPWNDIKQQNAIAMAVGACSTSLISRSKCELLRAALSLEPNHKHVYKGAGGWRQSKRA
jgi:hypothetical protein